VVYLLVAIGKRLSMHTNIIAPIQVFVYDDGCVEEQVVGKQKLLAD
jgi:hypothetical protein